MSSKVFVNPPNLPSSISGSGRHVMTLLKQFVGEVAEQVNLLNGYVANVTDNTLPVPSYFYLTFNNKGHEFEWDSVLFEGFDHYELRTDSNTGSPDGLLVSTTELKSTVPLFNRSGTIYLYVVTTNNVYSNPVTLSYTKAFPIAPYDIAVSRTDEGTLIFFAPLPLDCTGANIYINQQRFSTTTNSFLYTGSEIVSDILIAYFDGFGEGDFCDIYFDPPVVQNFIVERNDCYLDFKWDNVSLYNVRYVIRKGISDVWEDAEIIGEILTNSFRYVFPNDGNYYFLIKAYDEHGNCSATASYVILETVPDIFRNVLLVQQEAPAFVGSSVNLSFDDANDAIYLPSGQFFGEYYSSVSLPQKYRARNWIDYNVYSYSGVGYTWSDFAFSWDSGKGALSWSGELSNNTSVVKNEIALKVGLPVNTMDAISFNNTLVSENSVSPVDNTNISYGDCYFTDGLVVKPTDGVLYNLDIPQDFSCVFTARPLADWDADELYSGSFLKFIGDGVWLEVKYDDNSKAFILNDHLGNSLSASLSVDINDIIFIGISQASSIRKFFVKSKVASDLGYNFGSFVSQKYNSLFLGNSVGVLS